MNFSITYPLIKVQERYLTAKEPEQRVAHMPPIVAPGPTCQTVFKPNYEKHVECGTQ